MCSGPYAPSVVLTTGRLEADVTKGEVAEGGRGKWRVEALSGTVSESAIAALVDMHIPLPRGTVPKPKKHEQGKAEL